MKRKSGRKTNKKEENDSNGVEDNEQNGETSDHEEEDAPKDKRRKSSKGGRKNVSFTGKKDKEDATSTAESDASEDADQDEESQKEEKKSKGRKSSKKEKEIDPLAESEEDAEEEKKKSPKKGKKAAKKEKDKKEEKSKDEEPEEDEDDESQYEVEAVLDEKNIKGVRHYLIRWKGYEEESDTWEPENTLECSELITEFKEKKKKEKGHKKPIKKDKKDSEKPTWDEDADYEVNRILEVHHLRGGKREFLIHWKGYSQSENTWEPEENLDCKELIEKFMAKVDKARELEDRELRVNRKQVQRYTLNPQAEARRMSRRFRYKERVQYHDAE